MTRSSAQGSPDAAPYAVVMAYRVRFYMDMNAREAMHVIELRTAPQGHPSYRRICQAMHRAIADVAGHRAIADGDAVRRSLGSRAGAAAVRAGAGKETRLRASLTSGYSSSSSFDQ